VLLTRNAVLRTREFYADLRASSWEGPDSALSRMLAGLRVRRARWRWLDFHPSSHERQEILRDCAPLFRPEFGLAVATGATAAVAIQSGAVLVNDLIVFRFSGRLERTTSVSSSPVRWSVASARTSWVRSSGKRRCCRRRARAGLPAARRSRPAR
jgi:hypothetical protein